MINNGRAIKIHNPKTWRTTMGIVIIRNSDKELESLIELIKETTKATRVELKLYFDTTKDDVVEYIDTKTCVKPEPIPEPPTLDDVPPTTVDAPSKDHAKRHNRAYREIRKHIEDLPVDDTTHVGPAVFANMAKLKFDAVTEMIKKYGKEIHVIIPGAKDAHGNEIVLYSLKGLKNLWLSLNKPIPNGYYSAQEMSKKFNIGFSRIDNILKRKPIKFVRFGLRNYYEINDTKFAIEHLRPRHYGRS